MIFRLLVLLLCTSASVLAQRNKDIPNIADCDGGINIDRPGNYTLEFTGGPGDQKELGGFPSLTNKVEEVNTLWCSFVAPFNGFFTLDAFSESSVLDMIIFKGEVQDMCSGILSGAVEIERLLKAKTPDSIGLNKSPDNQNLYGIDLKRGDEIYLMFNISEAVRKNLYLHIEYLPNNQSEAAENMKQVLDLRSDVTAPELQIKLRDKSTGLPVKGQLIIKESKTKNALYMGSDFKFTVQRRNKIKMNIDAQGYFLG